MRIIYLRMDYDGSLVIAETDTLEGRREQLAQRFFWFSVFNENACLLYLLNSRE